MVIDVVGPQLDNATEDKKDKEVDLSAAEADKTAATNNREDARAAHATALLEYDAAIEACNQALTLVTENLLDNNTAFLQRSPVMI